MLDAMIIKNVGGRSMDRIVKKTTQLLSDEKRNELNTPRQEILNSGANNGDKVLDINREQRRVYGRKRHRSMARRRSRPAAAALVEEEESTMGVRRR